MNVGNTVNEGLCTSCGVCNGSCRKDAIAFHYGREKNIPYIDFTRCVECGVCYQVCPGKGINLVEEGNKLYKCDKNTYAGHYLNAYIGHSNNYDIRYHSATGGMVTSFLVWLLRNKIIDGAVVVRFKKENPFEAEPFIATTEEEIIESKSSKYVVVSMDKVAWEIAHSAPKRLVVVGLPCHIQGWRLLAKRNQNIKQAIVGYFAIYCSLTKTKHSIDYYLIRYKIDKSKVRRFAFRDDGCMGYMKFSDEKNDIKKIPYESFWFGTHSFFANPRCSLCIDQFGELADISFGDIHIKPYSEDTIGTNSIIIRSEYWGQQLSECQKQGIVTLDEISIDTLLASQIYTQIFKKGAGAKTNFLLRKIMRKATPKYDYKYTGTISLKNIVAEISKALMRGIGKNPRLWFIVRLLDRNQD